MAGHFEADRRHGCAALFSTGVGSDHRTGDDDFSVDIGFGYRYNNWLRFEGTYEYRTAAAGKNTNSALCPTSLAYAPSGADATTATGYIYDQTGGQTRRLHRRPKPPRVPRLVRRSPAAYLDLGNYSGVTPYVGGGLGLNADMISGNVGYTVNCDRRRQ